MKNRAIAVLGLLAGASFAEAATVLTLEEAIRIALENNGALEHARISSALTDVSVGDARSAFMPRFDLSASSSESYGRTFSEREGRLVNDTTRSVSVGASTGLTLFKGFANVAALRHAQFTAQAGRLELARARETLISAVITEYFAYLAAQDQIRVQEDRLASELKLQDRIEIYIEGGSRTRADLYAQQVTVANARLAVSEAERATALTRFDLLKTIGLSSGTSYEIKRPPKDEEIGALEKANPSVLADRALAQRQDLAAEEARVRATEQSTRAARAGRWPSVALGAGYGSGFTDASALPSGEQLDLNRGGSIGLSIALPLFDGGQTGRAIRRATLQARSARVALDEARREVEQQVHRAHLDLRVAREQLALAQATERAALLALDAAEDRYRLGAATLVELSQARVAHGAARTTLISARYNVKRQGIMLDYAVGDPLRQM